MKTVMRLGVFASLALLAGCDPHDPTPEATDAPAAAAPSAGPESKQGITASDGKLILPAVKGRPGAAYFMLSNSGARPVTLAAVTIEGAGKAEMHETKAGTMAPLPRLDVPAGDMVMFERGGKHVMAFDLAPTIKAGGAAEMTLTFADGDKVSLPLTVETAGGGDTMDHGAMH